MRIDSSIIGMESARSYRSNVSVRTTFESLVSNQMTTGSQLTDQNEATQSGDNTKENKGLKSDSLDAMSVLSTHGRSDVLQKKSAQDKFQRLHELAIQSIFRLLFGMRNERCNKIDSEMSNELTSQDPSEDTLQYQLVPYHFTLETIQTEYEETSFSTKGIVNTADGRSIDINIDITMSRTFESTFYGSGAGFLLKECDPLVINLDDSPAGLSDLKFRFDLDKDGEEEEISRLKAGCGFLALDKNDDGVINDGSELFGPNSGDGFKDLAMYDEDGNGWIDENDSIFSKLKIWVKDSEDNDVLYTLKEKDIGAIYLGSASTEFAQTSAFTGEINGHMRRSGIFLYENGQAGTLHHIDMVS